MNIKLITILVFIAWISSPIFGQQVYPVSVIALTPVPIPPHSLDLSVYGNQRSQDLLFQATLNDPIELFRDTRLKIYIENNGSTLYVTDPNQAFPTLRLNKNQAIQINGNQLQPYLRAEALTGMDFSAQGSVLIPEGLNRICIEIIDLERGVPISKKVCATAHFVLNDPPQLRLPLCGTSLSPTNSQNLVFNWLPMHLGSGNNPAPVEYQFKLVELLPGTEPNDGFDFGRLVYEQSSMIPSLIYGPNAPQLEEGKLYAWRVQAKNKLKSGKYFRNDGFSAVCTFTFQEESKAVIENHLLAESEEDKRIPPQSCEVFQSSFGPIFNKNYEPTPIAAGDIIKLGWFELNVDAVAPDANGYSGTGSVAIPLLNTNVAVQFKNIKVKANTLRCYAAESIQAIGEQGLELDLKAANTDFLKKQISKQYIHQLAQYFARGKGQNRLLSQLNSADNIAHSLPIGMDQAAAPLVAITNMRFTPDNCYITAVAFEKIGTGKYNAYAGKEIAITPYGVKSNHYLSPITSAEQTVIAEVFSLKNQTSITAPGMKLDCKGFAGYDLQMEMEIDPQIVQPIADKEKVSFRLSKASKDLNTYLGKVHKIEDFKLPKLPDFVFSAKGGLLDLNPKAAIPENKLTPFYKAPNQNNWQGLYLEDIKVKLPTAFDFSGKQKHITLNKGQLSISKSGCYGQFTKTNLIHLKNGKIGNWRYSIDTLLLNIKAGSAAYTHIAGQLQVPLIEEVFAYQGKLKIDNQQTSLLVNPQPGIKHLKLWKATLDLKAPSKINANLKDFGDGKRQFIPDANLSGVFAMAFSAKAFDQALQGNKALIKTRLKHIFGYKRRTPSFKIKNLALENLLIDPFQTPENKYKLQNFKADKNSLLIGNQAAQIAEVRLRYEEQSNGFPHLILDIIVKEKTNLVQFSFVAKTNPSTESFEFSHIEVKTENVECDCRAFIPLHEVDPIKIDNILERVYEQYYAPTDAFLSANDDFSISNPLYGPKAVFGILPFQEKNLAFKKAVIMKLKENMVAGFPILNNQSIHIPFLNVNIDSDSNFKGITQPNYLNNKDLKYNYDYTANFNANTDSWSLPIDVTDKMRQLGITKTQLPPDSKLLITGIQLNGSNSINEQNATFDFTLLVKIDAQTEAEFTAKAIKVGPTSINMKNFYMHLEKDVPLRDPLFDAVGDKKGGLAFKAHKAPDSNAPNQSKHSYLFLTCTTGFEYFNLQGEYAVPFAQKNHFPEGMLKFRDLEKAYPAEAESQAIFAFSMLQDEQKPLHQFIAAVKKKAPNGKDLQFVLEGQEGLIFQANQTMEVYLDFDANRNIESMPNAAGDDFRGLYFQKIHATLEGFITKNQTNSPQKPYLNFEIEDFYFKPSQDFYFNGMGGLLTQANLLPFDQGVELGGWTYSIDSLAIDFQAAALDQEAPLRITGALKNPLFKYESQEDLLFYKGFLSFTREKEGEQIKYHPNTAFTINSFENKDKNDVENSLEGNFYQVDFIPGLILALSEGSTLAFDWTEMPDGQKGFLPSADLTGTASLFFSKNNTALAAGMAEKAQKWGIDFSLPGATFEGLKINKTPQADEPGTLTLGNALSGIQSVNMGVWGIHTGLPEKAVEQLSETAKEKKEENKKKTANQTKKPSKKGKKEAIPKKTGLNGFPIAIDAPEFEYIESEQKWAMNLAISINLMAEKGKTSPPKSKQKIKSSKTKNTLRTAGIAATTKLSFYAKPHAEKGITFDGIGLKTIHVQGRFASAEIEGALHFLKPSDEEEKATWGEGFKAYGNLKIGKKADGSYRLNGKALFQFGTVNRPKTAGDFRYFFADLEAIFQTNKTPHNGLPLISSGGLDILNLHGGGGGIFYNMEKDATLSDEEETAESEAEEVADEENKEDDKNEESTDETNKTSDKTKQKKKPNAKKRSNKLKAKKKAKAASNKKLKPNAPKKKAKKVKVSKKSVATNSNQENKDKVNENAEYEPIDEAWMEPGASLSGFSYTPKEKSYGCYIKGIFSVLQPQLVSLDLAIGVEVGLNQADKFVFKKIFAKGDGYMMSEALENRQDAPIYATAEIELDFANKILSGAFSLDADYELEPVLSLKIDGQKTRGSMLVEMKEGGQFYLKAGRPVERMKAELSAFGTDFTIQNYFQLGKDLDPMPDVADIVPGWPVPAEKIQDRNISPTSGIALGMSLYIEKNYDFAIFYANFRGALGFDVAMGRSNLTCPDGVQVGLDGWMMKGQIFAYAGVDVGMRYDLGLLEGEINILSANIGASLRGQFPNPSVFTGRLAGNYSVLGGLLEGNFNLKFQVASDKDKECLKALISKPNPLAEFPLVADKYPAASEKEVPIFANPQLAYNLHVGKEIRVDDIDENGNDLIRYFKASLAPSEGFVLRKVGSSELIPCRTIFEGKSTTLKPIQMLEPQTKYEISWKLNWQQKQNGVWVNLKNDDGTDMAEIDRLSFTTGALPDVIVKDLLDYHAPGHHQKYWHHGYANTRIKFDKAAPAGSNWQKEYFPKSKEVAGFGRINYDYIIRITRFHNGEKEGVFDLPLSEYPGLKNFQQPVTTYKQIGSLFLIPKVEVKNVQGLNVGFADLDKLITNDAAWKGKLYQLQLIRLPLLPKTQLEENQTLIAQTGETTQNNTKGLVLSGNNLDAAQDYQVKLVKTSLKNRNSQLPPEDGLKVLYEYWFATSKYDNLNKKIEAAQVQALDPSNVSNTHFDHPDDAVDLGFRFKSNAIGLGHFKDDFYGFSPPLEGFDQYDLDRIRLNAIIQYPDKAKNTDIQGVESYAPLADNLLLPDLIFAWEGASRGNRYTNLQRNNSIKTYRKWLKNSVSLSQDNLIRYWKKRMIPPSNHPDWMVNFHLPNQVQAPYLTKEETDNKRLLPYQQYKGKSLWKTASKPLFSQDQTFALVFQDIYSRVRGLQYIALRQSVDGYKSDLDHSFNKANMGKYEDRFRDKWADWFWRGPKDYGFYSPNRYMMKRGDSVQSPWSLVDFKNRYRSLYEGKAIGTQLNSIYYKGKVEISLPILDKWQDMGQSIRQSKDFYPIHRISAYPKRSGTTTPIKTERLQAKEKGGKTFQFSDQVVSSSIYLVDYPRTEALVSLEIKVKKYYKTRKAAALSPNDKKEDFRRVAFWEAKSKELDLYNFSTGKRAIKYGVSLTGEENRAFMGDEGCETCINLSKLFQIPNSDWERDFITTVDNRFYHAGHYKIYLKTAAKTYVYEHYFDTKLSAEDTRPPMYQDYSHRIEPLSQTSEPNYNSLRNKALHFYRGAGVLSNMLILNTVGINKNWDLGACLIIDKTTQQAIAHLNAQQELTLFHYDKNGFYTTKSAYIQGEPIVELNPQHEYILYVAKQGQSHYSASLLLDSHHFWQDKVGQFFEENTFSDALQLAPVEVPQLIAFNKNGNQKELAIPIPGQWSAADFAQPNIPLLKGNGMAYMDKNQSSNNGYRPNDLVEFNPYNQLKNLQAGEWLTYVLNAPTNATFLLKIKATTQNSQGRFNIIIDGKRLPNMPLSFGTYQNNPKLFDPIIELTGGRHELKLEVLDPISNLDFIALVPHQPKLEVTGNQQIIPHNAIAVQLENGTNFGNQPCSDAPPMIFKIANKGLGKIKLRAGVNIQLSGPHAADFKVVSNPKLIALGAHDSTHFAIQFFPTDKNIGLRKAKVQFHYQDDNQSKKEFSFSIQASNYPLQVAFGTENEIFTNSSISGSDDPRNFGNIFDLNKKTKSYTIHNQGNTPIQLNKWLTGDATSEFEIEAFPKQLAANSQHIFKVHYTPNSKSKGIQTVDLNIAPVGCQQSAATLQLSALIAGSALHFDGLDDCIEIANQNQQPIINGGDALTVEYWFKGTNMQSALRFQDGSDFVVAAWQNNRHILSNDGFPEGLATGNATDGNWHHVAFTWERNKENGFKSYLDGQLVDQKKSSNNPLPIIRKGAFLGALNGQSEFMAGTLDEVRIWNRSLSQTELQGRMHCELQGDEFGLRLYYNFNQGIAGIENETINTVNNGQSDQNSGFLQNFELNQSTSNWVSSHHAFSQNEFCSFKMPLMQLSNQAGTILANNAIIPFGRLKAGREKELTFTIRNLGNAPLIFKENALLLSGTHANQFSIRPAFDLTNIPVGEEAIFNIVFTPLDINGDCQAQLKIADHFTLSLQGMAENAVLSLTGNQELINKGSMTARTANHTDFSNQSIGFTTSRLFTIKNEGAMPLQLNDIIISGPDKGSFKVIPPGQKLLQAAESTSFKIAFSPTKKALHKATIHIGNNSTINDTAWSFAVAGTGIAPANVLAFDGLDDYIEAPAGHYFEDNFTIETWLYLSYPNNVYGSSNLLSFSDASNQNKLDIALYKNVHLAITRAGQTQQIQTNEYLPQKKWTHLAISFLDNQAFVYLNGKLWFKGSIQAPKKTLLQNCFIGRSNNAGQLVLDEFRIWNRWLNEKEILARMNCELTGDETGLALYYNFNQGTPAGNNQQVAFIKNNKTAATKQGVLKNFALQTNQSNWLKIANGIAETPCANYQVNPLVIRDGNHQLVTSAASLDFGDIAPNQQASQILELTNISSTALSPTFSFSGEAAKDFSIMNPSLTPIPPKGTAKIKVVFQPKALHNRRASLAIKSPNGNDLWSATLNGYGAKTGATALIFDGQDDYIDLPNANYLGTHFSIETWMAQNYEKSNAIFFNFFDAKGNHIQLTNSSLDISTNGQRQSISLPKLFQNDFDAAWKHIALTVADNQGQLYLNGNLIQSFTINLPTNPNFTNGRIGQNAGIKLDEFRIWKQPLSSQAINVRMNCELEGTEKDLILYYKLNQGLPNGNNGKVTQVENAAANAPFAAFGQLIGFDLKRSNSPIGPISNWIVGESPVNGNCGKEVGTLVLRQVHNAAIIQQNSATESNENPLNLGKIALNKSISLPIEIENASMISVEIAGVQVSGANFADFDLSLPEKHYLQAGETTRFQLSFNPQSAGIKKGKVMLQTNLPNVWWEFDIIGEGLALQPQLVTNLANAKNTIYTGLINQISQNTPINHPFTGKKLANNAVLDLGKGKQGSNPVFTIQLKNEGGKVLNLLDESPIELIGTHSNQFKIYEKGNLTAFSKRQILPLDSLEFDVHFIPDGSCQNCQASLRIQSDDPEGNYMLQLQGQYQATDVKIGLQHQHKNMAHQDTLSIIATVGYDNKEQLILQQVSGKDPLLLTGNPKLVLTGADKAAFDAVLDREWNGGIYTHFVSINFKPSERAGLHHAQLVIPNNDPNTPNYTIHLKGQAKTLQPEINIRPQYYSTIVNNEAANEYTDFGEVHQGDYKDLFFAIVNTGVADLQLTNTPLIKVEGENADEFEVFANSNLTAFNTATLAPNEEQNFLVRFTPNGNTGDKTAYLSVLNNDADEGNYIIHLKGHGLLAAPEIDLQDQAGNSIDNEAVANKNTDFGSVKKGSYKDLTFTIANMGKGPLYLQGNPKIKLVGPHAAQFSIQSDQQLETIPAGSSSNFTIRYTPISEQEVTAQIIIATNDEDASNFTINLKGKGIPGILANSGTALHFNTGQNRIHIEGSYQMDINNWSIECYLKPEKAGSFLEQDLSSGSLKFFIDNQAQLQLEHISWSSNWKQNKYTLGQLTWNQWQHIAIVKSANSLQIYLNGELHKSLTTAPMSSSNSNFNLGKGESRNSFAGAIDELRIWNQALSQTTIMQRKDCELKGDEQGLLGYYDFNQGQAGLDNTNTFEESTYTHPWTQAVTVYKNFYALDRTKAFNRKSTMYHFKFKNQQSNWIKGGSPVKIGVHCAK